jgi:uncharacterized protein DUF6789
MTAEGAPEPRFRRAARGALAGGVATITMSAVQFPGAVADGRLPPPLHLARRLHEETGTSMTPQSLLVRGAALHLAIGTALGALYAAVVPRRARELTATAFAGLIYLGSYRWSLPSLGLHPHGSDDDHGRHVTNVLGHAVYGLTLAEVLRWTDPADDGVADAHEDLDALREATG